MGKLIYNTIEVEFDDRALVHLQIVIGTKLRRGESFFLSWNESSAPGSDRSSLWLHPSIPLLFKYCAAKTSHINRAWIDVLTTSAGSGQGLVLTPEPKEMSARQRAVIERSMLERALIGSGL